MRKSYYCAAFLIFFIALVTLPGLCMAQFYRCIAEDGSVSISDYPCADDAEVVQSSDYDINTRDPRPEIPESHDHTLRHQQQGEPKQPAEPQKKVVTPKVKIQEEIAYRCTKMDGSVFFQLAPCPERASVTINVTGTATGAHGTGRVKGPVTQEIISKDEACQGARSRKARVQENANRIGLNLSSVMSIIKCRIKPVKFHPCIFCGKLPVNLSSIVVSHVLPG